MERRTLLKTLGAVGVGHRLAGATAEHPVALYLESLRKRDGAYGWAEDDRSHVTPSYFAIECYRLLGLRPPSPQVLGDWIRANHPLPKPRHTDRPLRRFWFEQIVSLQGLGMDVADFRPLVDTWKGPIEFTKRYELGGNPVFQQEVHALRCRELLGMPGTAEWMEYVSARRRANGTYNNTPASDGSDGHVMNTLWGLQAASFLRQPVPPQGELVKWIEACQLPNGGFTYAPGATVGAIDDVVYTWAAVKCLQMLGRRPAKSDAVVRYVHSLADSSRGLSFRDREDRLPSPMGTFYALDTLSALKADLPKRAAGPAPKVVAAPSKLRIWTMQVQAPGSGSPSEAVELARALEIHLWAAKNSAPGWIESAQKIANERKVPVQFCVGNEEYGTFFGLPGLGTYSHLSDIVAPAGRDFGPPLTPKEAFVPWERFRDERLRKLRAATGQEIWQFNENEELTRVLLDEAVRTGSYAAVASFHFGNENFLNTQPFLMRYSGVLPFVALQDAHAAESWWWGEELEGLRTVFLAEDPSWEAWLDALKMNRVMSIRQDAFSNHEAWFAGGDRSVRSVVLPWWRQGRPRLTRPLGVLTVVRPDDAHESFRPDAGVRVRVRSLRANSRQGMPLAPRAELVRLLVDGKEVEAQHQETKNAQGRVSDAFYYADLSAGVAHRVEAEVRDLKTRESLVLRAQVGA